MSVFELPHNLASAMESNAAQRAWLAALRHVVKADGQRAYARRTFRPPIGNHG